MIHWSAGRTHVTGVLVTIIFVVLTRTRSLGRTSTGLACPGRFTSSCDRDCSVDSWRSSVPFNCSETQGMRYRIISEFEYLPFRSSTAGAAAARATNAAVVRIKLKDVNCML